MARSVWKGPFVEPSLLEKIEKQLRKHKNRAQDLIIKKGFEEKNKFEG